MGEVPTSPEDIALFAIKKAANKINPALAKVLEIYLKEMTGEGLEIAYKDPDNFLKSVRNLFGDYGGRFFELATISEIRDIAGIIRQKNNLKEILKEMGIY